VVEKVKEKLEETENKAGDTIPIKNIEKKYSEARLRHAEYAFCANHMEKGKSLITVFTTMHPSKDALKMLAQENVLQSYANLAPLVKGIVFTTSQYWIDHAKKLGIQVITNNQLNPHGKNCCFI
jgi:hypothetical protein